MFDVYLSDRRDHLLVVEKGQKIPIDQHLGRWHKKRVTVAISEEIRTAVQRNGYYSRRLREPPAKHQGREPSVVGGRPLLGAFRSRTSREARKGS
jgi:hypothetical protein